MVEPQKWDRGKRDRERNELEKTNFGLWFHSNLIIFLLLYLTASKFNCFFMETIAIIYFTIIFIFIIIIYISGKTHEQNEEFYWNESIKHHREININKSRYYFFVLLRGLESDYLDLHEIFCNRDQKL